MARSEGTAQRRLFDNDLKRFDECRQEKDDLALKKTIQNKGNEYIENLYLYKMYERPVCWRTVQVAKIKFGQLKSRAAQFWAVRRQILI